MFFKVRIDTQTVTFHDQPSTPFRRVSMEKNAQAFYDDRNLDRGKSLRRRSGHAGPLIEEQQESYYLVRYWHNQEEKIKGNPPKCKFKSDIFLSFSFMWSFGFIFVIA